MTTTIEQPRTQRIRQHIGKTTPAPVTVQKWIDECISLCTPDHVHVCNGSDAERKQLIQRGERDGVFIRLNPEKRPNCFLHRSNPNDVARTEQCTFICVTS